MTEYQKDKCPRMERSFVISCTSYGEKYCDKMCYYARKLESDNEIRNKKLVDRLRQVGGLSV